MKQTTLFTTLFSVLISTISYAEKKAYYVCKPCPKGTYLQDKVCKPCPAGKYQDEVGQNYCKSCPAGNYCPQKSVAPIPCDGMAGQWAPEGSSECRYCTTLYGDNWDASYSVPLAWGQWNDHGLVCYNKD